MKNRQADTVVKAIRQNSIQARDWGLSQLAARLYKWIDIFNAELFKDAPVRVPVISFEKTRIENLGKYIRGRNAFGVKETINLNPVHLNRPLSDILATLLHELAHSWQEAYGKPSGSWFHNKEFKIKLRTFGIRCDSKGRHLGVKDPFVSLLKSHGVSLETTPDSKSAGDAEPVPKGRSKLKKWECSCGQIARIGKKGFFATCSLCGKPFDLVK